MIIYQCLSEKMDLVNELTKDNVEKLSCQDKMLITEVDISWGWIGITVKKLV